MQIYLLRKYGISFFQRGDTVASGWSTKKAWFLQPAKRNSPYMTHPHNSFPTTRATGLITFENLTSELLSNFHVLPHSIYIFPLPAPFQYGLSLMTLCGFTLDTASLWRIKLACFMLRLALQ